MIFTPITVICVSFKIHSVSLFVLCVSAASPLIKPILLASPCFLLPCPVVCHRKQHSQHSMSSDWQMCAAPIEMASVHWQCLPNL
ncbi:hypothetical protein PO909_004571 [Leuciscus waleckii]